MGRLNSLKLRADHSELEKVLPLAKQLKPSPPSARWGSGAINLTGAPGQMGMNELTLMANDEVLQELVEAIKANNLKIDEAVWGDGHIALSADGLPLADEGIGGEKPMTPERRAELLGTIGLSVQPELLADARRITGASAAR